MKQYRHSHSPFGFIFDQPEINAPATLEGYHIVHITVSSSPVNVMSFSYNGRQQNMTCSFLLSEQNHNLN